jgi:transglutaminase-like putative cysteine protease
VNRYRISHTTRYDYEAPVVHAHHLAYLRPRNMPRQRLEDWHIHVEPEPLTVTQLHDYFGNDCTEIELLSPHDALAVTCTSAVELDAFDFDAQELPKTSWDECRARLADPALVACAEFAFDSPLVRAHPRFVAYVGSAFSPGRPLVAAALELNQRIFEEFTYDATVSDVSTPLARVLSQRRGVCQDFAHLMIGCLRSLGLAARYVSGYLETVPPDGSERLIGADASHAWAQVFVPEHGWLDVDPTNGVVPGSRHITLAYGRDFSDVSPLKGVVLGGGAHRLGVSVDVELLS